MWDHPSSATGHELAARSYDPYDTNMATEMSYTEIKNNLGDVLAKAARGEPTIGTTRGRRTIAIVPIEEHDEYVQSETGKLRDLIRAREGEPTTNLTEELEATVTAVEQTGAPDAREESDRAQ